MHDQLNDMETISMDDVEILPTDVITDSLPALPEIPDFPDIPENVIIVPADPLPTTSECLSYPQRLNTITVSGVNTQLTYVTEGNVSYRCQPVTGRASNATTTTNNDPTVTEKSFKPPTLMMACRPKQAESGPSPPKKQKTDDTVFLTPLPVTGHARPLTRITKKPKPSSNSDQNTIIKALLAQNSTPYIHTRVSAPRHRNFIIRASTQTASGKTKILNIPVSASMPVPLANLQPGNSVRPIHAQNAGLLTQCPLRSAFVKTTTAADFIPQSSTVDTVMTTHVTTTTAITTPMTAAPQLTYAISPIRVATSSETAVTTTITSSTGQSLVLISSPSTNTRPAGATQSQTYVPVQHFYKASMDANAAAKKIHNLVRSKAIPASSGATVTAPASIITLGAHGSITTTAGVAILDQRPSANTRAKTHNYTYLEPGEITQISKVPPRTFPGPRSTCVAQRQTSAAASMQQQTTIISKMKAAKHAKHHIESQSMSGLEIGSAREMQHAASLAALQEASHARLVAASQEARLKVQQHALFQAKIQAAVEAQKAAATSPTAAQAQALPALLQLPVTTQLQIAALGPTQTASLAQPHGTLNVQLVTPAQAQLLADAKAQLHAASHGQIHGIPQTQRVAYGQAQGQPLAVSRPQDESLTNSQLQSQTWATSYLQGQSWATSRLQGQPLATSQQPDQPLATSQPPDQPLATCKLQGHHLAASQASTYVLGTSKPQGRNLPISQASTYILATSQAQLLATSQSTSPVLITSQRHAQNLAKTQSQGPILVAPQRQAVLATTQSQGQLLATSQAQSYATLPSQPNMTRPMQIKSSQANATLIAQLNAPPQMIISRGQQNVPRMQLHGTPAQLKNITQAQLNAITQAQLKTSQWRQQAASPTQIQMSSPPQQSAAHGQPRPRIRRRLIIRTANPAPQLDKTPVIQIATKETVAASTSLNEQLPSTSNASQQIGEVPSSSIHTTSTLTLSTGTTLIMPHYKTTVFKNLSSIGCTEPTQLPTPTTTTGEILVMRRPATFFPARRTFPTSTQSSTAPTTTTTTATTTPLIHIIRTVPRHMLGSLETGNVRARLDGPKPEILTHIITPKEPDSEEE